MANRILSIAKVGSLALVFIVPAMARHAYAQKIATVASDRAAGYVVFPKIVVDTSDAFSQGRSVDTVVQLTNTSTSPRVVHCFYIDASSRCNNGPNRFGTGDVCRAEAYPTPDCVAGGGCVPQWSGEINFTILLTPNQPTGWSVSSGIRTPQPGNPNPQNVTPGGSYFIGELKCVEVDGADPNSTTATPIFANDLKGEATIYEVSSGTPGEVDVRSYNAIGVQATVQCTAGSSNQGLKCTSDGDCGNAGVCNFGKKQSDKVLCLGGTTGSSECPVSSAPYQSGDYASCPSTLILDNRFDTSSSVIDAGYDMTRIRTDLTLVPCSEDITAADLASQTSTTVQFNVYNEFEQKMSASTRISCFVETQLSHIDKRPGQERFSVFNVGVQGTLTGQTRITPVQGNEVDTGHGILAVAEEYRELGMDSRVLGGGAAYNLNYAGVNAGKGDFVRYVFP